MPEGSISFIYVIDDDREVRRSLTFQLATLGYEARPFAEAGDFLDVLGHVQPGCILLDHRMPGMDGLETLDALKQRGIDWPVIVMTGHAAVTIAVAAMKQGAFDFLEKPFDETLLIEALRKAFEELARRTTAAAAQDHIRVKLQTLSPREREVLEHLTRGEANKRIAHELGLSVRTVEMHRGKLLAKMGVRSVAEAISIGVRSRLFPAE